MKQNNKPTDNDHLSPLIDSPEDREKLKPESVEIDLPGVEDIPGQENVIPPPMGELSDTTISSADEEGDSIFEENIDKDLKESADSNVSDIEKRNLHIAANDMPGDDENLRQAALDSTDEDGTPLNEGSFGKNVTPDDLDIPGTNDDDDNEEIGEEDEENNEYSLGGDDNEDAPRDDF
ncbi:MAG TPA: hypothetical protein VJ279_09275 [Hanamia sp.]|nr:hypothetical protein [Hanamia sp.]